MAQQPIPDAEVSRFAAAYERAVAAGGVPHGRPVGTGRVAAMTLAQRDLGITRAQAALRMQRMLAERIDSRRGLVGGPPIPEIARPPEGMEVSRNAGEYDPAGNLRRQWVGTRRAAGGPFEVPAGHMVKGESALLDPDGRLLARWVKTREGASGHGFVDALRAALADVSMRAVLPDPPAMLDGDLLTVYPLPDLHLGMYAWGRETGADYDVAIAEHAATEAIGALVAQSRPSRQAVLVFLGDYFHANDQSDATPTSKHRLDVDGRWDKVFRAGAHVARALVDMVGARHELVEVVCLPGNHDPDAAVCLRVAPSLAYAGHPRVTVAEQPGLTWYRRHGRCLLGATHGHTMHADRAAMMMASDRAEDWGATTHRHMMCGHVHRETLRECGPVRVESFGSPAARDAYAHGAGWRSGRALTALTYHADRGEIGRHRVTVAPRNPTPATAA